MDQYITIGRITGPFGLEGDLKVSSDTDYPERFASMKRIFLRQGNKFWEKEIVGVMYHNGRVLIRLSGVETPEEGKKLRGTLLQIPEEEVWPLPEGSYYWYQIVGLSVYTESGRLLGQVSDVLETGGNDVYAVKDQSGKEYLIPATREVVRSIDLQGQKILVRPLPGLLEE
jgi:16S rRNA processing protein RimM